MSWDRTILSESLSISLAVGALAAWIRFAKKPAPANSVAVVVLSGLWIFTKLGLFPIVAVAAVLVAIAAVRAGPRVPRIAVAGGLAAMCVWAAATTSATDKAYAVVDGCATWTTFLAAYAARTDLATWVEDKGRPVFERYVLTHPRKFASDFITALPYMVAPPRTAVVYTTSVRDVLPDAVQSLVFDTPSDVRPTLGDVGLLGVALVVLSVVARRRAVDRTLVVVAAVGAVLAIGGLAESWIASPAEIARHAVPEAVLLRLSLWLGVFACIDALHTRRIALRGGALPTAPRGGGALHPPAPVARH